jgi:hypothetical protein
VGKAFVVARGLAARAAFGYDAGRVAQTVEDRAMRSREIGFLRVDSYLLTSAPLPPDDGAFSCNATPAVDAGSASTPVPLQARSGEAAIRVCGNRWPTDRA